MKNTLQISVKWKISTWITWQKMSTFKEKLAENFKLYIFASRSSYVIFKHFKFGHARATYIFVYKKLLT